jgi:hypothetical protein
MARRHTPHDLGVRLLIMDGASLLLAGLVVLFAAAIVVGMTVRAVRASRGQRLRAAFAPIMGAGEVYQELHTGQKGLRDSVIESIQEQEHGGGADRGAGADRSGRDA